MCVQTVGGLVNPHSTRLTPPFSTVLFGGLCLLGQLEVMQKDPASAMAESECS